MSWNKKPFSIYTSEEKTTLKLMKELGEQTNYNTLALDEKTNLTGDHKGSWQGLSKPTLSDEGMRATVEKQIKQINNIEQELQDLFNIKRYPRLENETTDTGRIQRCLNENNGVFLPNQSEPYIIDGDGIKLSKNIIILGSGNNKTNIKYIGSKHCFYFKTDNKNDWTWENGGLNITIENINIIGTNKNGYGIYLDKYYRSNLYNVKIDNFNVGLYVASGWTNLLERLEIINCNKGIKIGDDSYNTETSSTSYINNATNITRCRIEYNGINVEIGDKNFNGTQCCSNINVKECTLQFSKDCEIEINSSTNVNILDNYIETYNSSTNCLIRIGYLNPSLQNGVSYDNNYLICDNIRIQGNILVGDNTLGQIVPFRFKNYENVEVANNTFFHWANVEDDRITSYKTLMYCDWIKPVKWNNNTYNKATRKIEGKFISNEPYFVDIDLKTNWVNGGSGPEEKARITYLNGVVHLDGIIATSSFADGQVLFYLGDLCKPKKQQRIKIRSRESGIYKATFFDMLILVDGTVKIASETTSELNVLLPLSNISFSVE